MFVNWPEQQLENDSDFYRKIIFSDEAHFWLNGFVNKQNMHYWSDSHHYIPKNYGLVRFMGRRHHWAVLFPMIKTATLL